MSNDDARLSIEQLYDEALSLGEEQRGQYLATHCPDVAVREDLLRRLSDVTKTVILDGEVGRLMPPAISVGARLGHYRIQRALGSGGMGFVYEAIDENLNRPVALKVLPVGRYDESSRMRFQREAEAASALNHPNIVTVHEVGRDGEIDFIAMERISGQTLLRELGERPMAVAKVVRVATQIADALAAAHEAGIVHRDLKPANVMVSDRGLVKVLDFGLAKQSVAPGAEGKPSQKGEISGTIFYMSPEQAEGKPVDARSDIFAFGILLYEMLTGKKPFESGTTLATVTSITTGEPEPLRALRPDVPRVLESVFKKCVQKQPHERWQNLSDVKLVLQDLAADLESGSERASARPPTEARSKWRWYAVAAVIAAGALIAAGLRVFRQPDTAGSTLLRLVTAERGLSTAPALSPDGSLLAFASDRSNQGNLDIWIQQAGGAEPIRLTTDPADETDPSFSPDGARIVFRSEKDRGGIFVIPALGGDPVLVAPSGRNPRFSPNGKSVIYWVGREGSMMPGSSKLWVADVPGGAPRPVEIGLAWAQYPVWSPDGSSLILYGAGKDAEDRAGPDWWTVPASGGKAKRVGARATVQPLRVRLFPIVLDWFSDDEGPQVLFAPDAGDSANLWRMGLRPDGTQTGRPVRLTNGPGRHVRASTSRSRDGVSRLAFTDESANYDVWQLPVQASTGLAAGPIERMTDRLTPEMNPSISGDAKQAYYITVRLGTWSLMRKDLETNRERILYSAPDVLYNSRVAPFGSKVFFSGRSGDIFAIPRNGGTIEKLCPRCGSVTGVSNRGDQILFQPNQDEHLMMFDVASGKTVKVVDRADPHVLLDGGQFSPDSKWAAFHTINNETQATAVYVAPISGRLPAPRDQWIPITDPSELSRDAVWAPASPFLYYTSERDGFRCIWARRLDPLTKVPRGEPIPVQHLHTSRLALRNRASSGTSSG